MVASICDKRMKGRQFYHKQKVASLFMILALK